MMMRDLGVVVGGPAAITEDFFVPSLSGGKGGTT
jgi:hypothetical protein